jgi:hypothetical protein
MRRVPRCESVTLQNDILECNLRRQSGLERLPAAAFTGGRSFVALQPRLAEELLDCRIGMCCIAWTVEGEVAGGILLPIEIGGEPDILGMCNYIRLRLILRRSIMPLEFCHVTGCTAKTRVAAHASADRWVPEVPGEVRLGYEENPCC